MNANIPYDAVIVGAGPAGSLSAALLASHGWKTLLLEKSRWPRQKACGGCLNAAAVRLLHESGCGHILANAPPITSFQVHYAGRTLSIGLPEGAAIMRDTFDANLANAAIARGAEFITQAHAKLLPDTDDCHRTLLVTHEGKQICIKANILLACDGLRGSLLAEEPWAAWQTTPDAWIGISATLPHAPIPSGTITMLVGTHGYVGLVRHADGRVHVGAAVNPAACNQAGGARRIVASILEENDMPLPQLETADFEGTRPLTGRRRTLGGYRVLTIGDACGYVEPFTGEGISWAIRGAIAAARLLPARSTDWPPSLPAAWAERYDHEIARRQVWCRWMRQLIRHPPAAGACLRAAIWAPWLPRILARRISA
jgi:flavin-dependent dehydrogenase